MFRSASLAILSAAITLGLTAPQVEAGGFKASALKFSVQSPQFNPSALKHSIQAPTFKPIKFCPPVVKPSPPVFKPICPPIIRPIHPPIICPPVVKPCPPIFKPICPPIVRPICPPPVVCPPKPPVICPPVCPPPVIKPICYKPPVICPPVVHPVCPPHCTCHKCTCADWYFGMSLQVVQTSFGIGLQVHDVTHGSPACQAGLEVGDVIVMAAGQSFATVQTNEQGVALLQSLATATSANFDLIVQDSRTSQIASLNITPLSQSAPAPAITTAMAF